MTRRDAVVSEAETLRSAIAANPRFSPYRDYLRHLVGSIQQQWDGSLGAGTIYPPIGSNVTVTFVLTANGTVDRIVDVENRSSPFGAKAAVNAIASAAPYGVWTPAMKSALGQEQELTFTFYYR